MSYVIIRSKDSGVFAGILKNEMNDTVTLKDARRLWYWSGAASLSQMAMEGVSNPKQCKFPIEVSEIKIFGVLEIIKTTKAAEKSIKNVPIWKA